MNTQRKNRMDKMSFFQKVVDLLFLSPQMNARKGIRKSRNRSIEAMLKEFYELNIGAFPGKSVLSLFT